MSFYGLTFVILLCLLAGLTWPGFMATQMSKTLSENCHSQPAQDCHSQPAQDCHSQPAQDCHSQPAQDCHNQPAQDCHSQPGQEPPNFSWLVLGTLCASAFPDQIQHLQYLIKSNITTLVSLTVERKVDRKYISEEQLKIVSIPIRDYTPPTVEQVESFIKCVQETGVKNQATCVHCAHGLGRTGTMLACYFVQVNNMQAGKAIEHVRKLRPGSVETPEQELLVHQFLEYLQTKAAAQQVNHDYIC